MQRSAPRPCPSAAIAVVGVSAGYGRRRPVLDDLTWSAREGRTILLGPNGAGKSTLLKVLAGVVRPTGGQLLTSGPVGYMPQTVRAVPGLTVADQVSYVAWLQGMSHRAARDEALRCLAQAGLADLLSERVTRLSGGQLRRVGLAQALVGSPPVLLLDEPTAGLDPAQRIAFARLLQGLSGAIIVATHQVDEMEETYGTVGVLHQGRFAFDGPLADFLALDATGHPLPRTPRWPSPSGACAVWLRRAAVWA